MKWILVLISFIALYACQDCVFPDVLLGNWTSSNFGLMTFSNSTSLTISKSFDFLSGSSTTSLNCILTADTQYILQSTEAISVFSGTSSVYMYMCLDLREANEYSYYFYLNSEEETGFSNERLVGIIASESVTSHTQVCTATLDIAEFHTMVKVGFENDAVQQCPTALLGNFWYSYYDAGRGPLCDSNSTSMDACNNQNATHLQFNSTECTDVTNPAFSADGQLGCLNNIENVDTSTSYFSLYNFDATVDSSSTYRFVCAAVSTDANKTVFVSMIPNECIAGQLATALPSAQSVRLEMYPSVSPIENGQDTCVPSDDDDKNWLWLILLLSLVFGLAIIAIIVTAVCCYNKKYKRKKSLEREVLESEKHPIGEVSLPLDVPLSMEPTPDLAPLYAVVEEREEVSKSAKKKKGKGGRHPFFESSMNLEIKGRNRKQIQNGTAPYVDPFTEMDSHAIVSISPSWGSKAARSLRNAKRIPFAQTRTVSNYPRPWLNGTVNTPLFEALSISDGRNYQDFEASHSVKSSGSDHLPSIQANSLSTANSLRALPGIPKPALSVRSPRRPKSKSQKSKPSRVSGSKLARSKSATSLGSATSPRFGSRKDLNVRSKTFVPSSYEREQSDVGKLFMAEAANNTVARTPYAVKSKKSKPLIKSLVSKKAMRLQRSKTTTDEKLSPSKKSISSMTGIPNYFRSLTQM